MQLACDVTGSFTEHPLDNRVDILLGCVGEAFAFNPFGNTLESSPTGNSGTLTATSLAVDAGPLAGSNFPVIGIACRSG